MELSGGNLLPPFGVFLKGKFPDKDNQDPEDNQDPVGSVLVVRIPYLGEKKQPESSEPQESWRLSKFISLVLKESEANALEDDGLRVHEAMFVVLSNGL